MRYHLDTEFHEDAAGVELISLALAADDGRMLYLVNADYNNHRASPWLAKHVIPHLLCQTPGHWQRVPYAAFAAHVQEFVNEGPHDEPVEFWGWFGAYDWYLFCRCFGGMQSVPARYPMLCQDTRQRMIHLGVRQDQLPSRAPYQPIHNALMDALWQKDVALFLDRIEKESRTP